jgi:hypothetical protein
LIVLIDEVEVNGGVQVQVQVNVNATDF